MGGRTHAFSTKRISDSEWRHFHRHARDFQHLLIVKTWGLIGSRSWPNSSPNFLFKKICVCNFALLPLAICHICPTHRTIFLWMFLNSETPEILFDIDLSQGFQYNGMGKGHRKGKHEEEVLVRTPELERRYTAPPSATLRNVTSYLFCLSLYLRKVIRPIEEQMVQLECFWKFSKFLTWVFRHSAQLLHTDLSLTLNELFWFNQFTKHMNTGLSYIQHRDY